VNHKTKAKTRETSSSKKEDLVDKTCAGGKTSERRLSKLMGKKWYYYQ
jgi:hypothetical protein